MDHQNSALHAFAAGAEDPDGASLAEAVSVIVSHAEALSEGQALSLQAAITERLPPEDRADFDTFDMRTELEDQITLVRAMRRAVMRDGRLNADFSTREAKEIAASANTLLGALMKFYDRTMTFERQRAFEKAIVRTAEALGEETKAQFLTLLEQELQAIDN